MTDLRNEFKVGGHIKVDDVRKPITMIIRNVGKEALGVELKGAHAKFRPNVKLTINNHHMSVVMPRGRHATLVLA